MLKYLENITNCAKYSVDVQTIECTWETIGLIENCKAEQSSLREFMPSEEEAIYPKQTL